MKISYLDFEQPIAELESQIEGLQLAHDANDALDVTKELTALKNKNKKLSEDIYSNLSAWQISQLARHPQRPYTLDYIQGMFTDFEELHGDRAYADDPAIVGGLARFEGQPVMVIGHQKGRDVKERQYRNFGMPRPEGYRKALRLFRLAEKFNIPIITLIDTPGAYPGIGAEERGQSEAIARNLYVMAELKTPIIGVIIGEGGSGGALALGVVDQLLMLQYGTYSVISPEGCASILYKSADKASVAAESLAITADRLKSLGLIDRVVSEPMGGAHRSYETIMANLRVALKEELTKLKAKSTKVLLVSRYERLMGYGKFKEVVEKERRTPVTK
jgi:acetyl-CoA carboxylase carboxyl transferase subunit alpha